MTIDEFVRGAIRYSAIKDYLDCPYKFNTRYLDGVRTDSQIMALGRTVERVITEALEGKMPTVKADSGSSCVLDTEGGELHTHPMQNTLFMADSGIDAIRAIAIEHDALPGVMAQRRFHTKLNFEGETMTLQTTTDFILPCKDGSVLLLDLKTCKDFGTWNEKKAAEDMQLSLYAPIVSHAFNGATVHSYYVAVNRTDFRARCLKAAIDPKAAFDKVYRAYDGMKAGDIDRCERSYLCPFCENYRKCKETVNDIPKGV